MDDTNDNAPPSDNVPPDEGPGDTSSNSLFATALNEDLTMNSLEYRDNGTVDPSDDTLLINNLPFDNTNESEGGYTYTEPPLPNGFSRYESPIVPVGEVQYFAVFRRSGYAQVGAVASGDYASYGYGGAAAQRFDAAGVPAERAEAYSFSGEYAAVRVTDGTDVVEYVTGEVNLQADITDFDNIGAVVGDITNRQLYDVNGNQLLVLTDVVNLDVAEIDFSNAAIRSSDANNGSGGLSGSWQGIFAGPNGEEIAGIVVLEGTAEKPNPVRETGAFIAAQPDN
ncbi:HupA family protein [Marimonas lutisalis]|uniref:hypothetical protein n=1 Tax=Marimonas lutisalis TaxID=2545756 RepID=UPI0010F91899|nr:hypothetical protein [Marimonas lutisalis]